MTYPKTLAELQAEARAVKALWRLVPRLGFGICLECQYPTVGMYLALDYPGAWWLRCSRCKAGYGEIYSPGYEHLREA